VSADDPEAAQQVLSSVALVAEAAPELLSAAAKEQLAAVVAVGGWRGCWADCVLCLPGTSRRRPAVPQPAPAFATPGWVRHWRRFSEHSPTAAAPPTPTAIQAAFQSGAPIDTNQASTLLKVAGVGYSLNDLLASLGGGSASSARTTQAMIDALNQSGGDEGPARAAGEPACTHPSVPRCASLASRPRSRRPGGAGQAQHGQTEAPASEILILTLLPQS
jgi:hypothetical protein